jgi:drug/metabolite transporter (DMT)-like permease
LIPLGVRASTAQILLDLPGLSLIKLLGETMTKGHIDLAGFLQILGLALLWGLNYPAIKLSNAGFSPVFTCFVRSCIASGLGIIYCLATRQPLFQRGMLLVHGCVTGILFGLEFLCLYLGMLYTDAARSVVFVYLSPFVVALGAHMFLGERLDRSKIMGLILAFLGVYLVFRGKPATRPENMLLGDILELLAALLWGATTLYIKRFLARKVNPIHTFLYQMVFSIPVLLAGALVLEERWVIDPNTPAVLSVLYQSVIIAFASYLAWFRLIHVYPVGILSAFTFLTPVSGVLFGVTLLGEEPTKGLLLGLFCVCAGIYTANYRRTP